ncbi:MAG: hypothetical protein CL608_16310 [Anaerolineaceae bacterium]|nr:hypothetical protein [Anaerolineaceae bacterium]
MVHFQKKTLLHRTHITNILSCQKARIFRIMDQSNVSTDKLFEEISHLREALARAQAEIQQLTQQKNQLQTEHEVSQALADQHKAGERPTAVPLDPDFADLAQQLRKAAIISQKLNTIREPDKLLNEAISLMRSSFNLYHVHIYLLDKDESVLRVHIGSGVVGRQLLEQEHTIALTAVKSLVALAARQQEMVLVHDVANHPTFLANPLLPKTKSELAIPLQYGRSLLGVLDIQDSQPNRFGTAEIDAVLVLAGHIAIALQNARLFTERHQIQKELFYQANLLQNVSDAIIATDNEFRIQSWNKAAETIYGWREEEVMGKTMGELMSLVYEQSSREEMLANFLSKGHWTGRISQTRKDGALIPVLSSVTAVKDQQGTVIGAVAVNRDITDQLKIEEALRERTRSLEASNEELAQFAYAASHDLQEPLRMITSYLQLIAQRYQDQLDDEAMEFIGYAVDGAKRMRQLIVDLLTYSRIGQQNQGVGQVELEKILQQVLFNLEVQIQEANIAITHDPLPTITADKTQMLQLLQNLISNAIKFRKDESPKVHISAQQEPARWVIQIADNGIGMQPEFTKKIFAIFQRLHTREEYPGTGIGLAICKKIVQKHKGEIWVDSEPGVGSTFSFSIPSNLT